MFTLNQGKVEREHEVSLSRLELNHDSLPTSELATSDRFHAMRSIIGAEQYLRFRARHRRAAPPLPPAAPADLSVRLTTTRIVSSPLVRVKAYTCSLVGSEQIPLARRDGGAVVAHGDELLVEAVHGIRIVELLGRVDLHVVRIHADPRLRRRVRRGEAGVPGSVPLHGSARVVTADEGEGRHHGLGRLAPGLLHALAVGVDGLQVAVLAEAW